MASCLVLLESWLCGELAANNTETSVLEGPRWVLQPTAQLSSYTASRGLRGRARGPLVQ